MRRPRKGSRRSSTSGSYVLSAADTISFIGGNLKWMFDRILRGGSSGHPLGDPVRYRWHRDSDTYILRPVEDSPALRLFRRGGQWRISFDNESLPGDTYLFESEHLDEPIYTPVALIYAMQVAAYPKLRDKAIQRLLSASEDT